MYFKVYTELWTVFLIFLSGFSDIQINWNLISEDLLYLKPQFLYHRTHSICVAKNSQLFLFMEIIIDEYTYGQNAECIKSMWCVYNNHYALRIKIHVIVP